VKFKASAKATAPKLESNMVKPLDKGRGREGPRRPRETEKQWVKNARALLRAAKTACAGMFWARSSA
jgi:hypothetical protein